jgi:hypothetical protein
MSDAEQRRPHIYLGATGAVERFTSPSQGGPGTAPPPARDRVQHGGALLTQLEQVRREQQQLAADAVDLGVESRLGIQIAFESFPGVEMAVASLADARQGIELTNVRHLDGKVLATVFVPEGKLTVFEAKLRDYLASKTDRNGKARDHRALIDAIAAFRAAALEALWVDTPDVFPHDETEAIWWEVWLPVADDRQGIIRDFRRVAGALELRIGEQVLEFPERSVVLAKGTRLQFAASGLLLNCIAEIRRSKETAEFFDGMGLPAQRERTGELLERLQGPDENAPYLCVLDTGINNGHPLLAPFLTDADQHSLHGVSTVADEHGHGTGMAGLAIWGDLTDALASDQSVSITHRLESVKVLTQPGDNEGRHYGNLTADAVALPEIAVPFRSRVFASALSATDGRDQGRPSAWSSALDGLASDTLGENAAPRLFTIAAGNTGTDLRALSGYPDYNIVQDIHDPGQAWNVLTIGAFTGKVSITEPGADEYQPLAPEGGLSPYSTTSAAWAKDTPLKPDVVFEGGNVGIDPIGCAGMHSLSLLTTDHLPNQRLLTTFWATSAATALAGRFAAQVLAQYPRYWPETIRALIVHSAEWTPQMCQQFAYGATPRQQAQHRVRCVGFGVPNLDQALWSANNSLALIVEDHLQPFEKRDGAVRTRDMHLHDLPWPTEVLQELGETQVELIVTLSYFIEPNPSSRNVVGKYSYASHQLRFDVRRPSESLDAFRKRINRDAGDAETGTSTGPGDPAWMLGKQFRHKGSIHKDIWRGTAADLAARGQIAVYPAMGWWRTRTRLQRYDKEARYALVVSIRVPEVDVDIYSPISAQVPVVQQV